MKAAASRLAFGPGMPSLGFTSNYHISSHDYYSLPLISIVALSLAPALRIGFFAQLK